MTATSTGRTRTWGHRALLGAGACALVIAPAFLAVPAHAVPNEAWTENPTAPGSTGDPMQMTLNDVTHKIYVAHESTDNTIEVLDAVTKQVTTTIPAVDNDIRDLLVDEDRNRVYISANEFEGIAGIDGTDDTVPAGSYVKAPGQVRQLAWGPGDTIFQGLASGSVISFDVNTGTYGASVQVGGEPAGMDYDNTRGWLYVAVPSTGQVKVIRASDLTVVATIQIGQGPVDVAVDETNNEVWVARWDGESGGGGVSIIDGADNTAVGVGTQIDYPYSIEIDEDTHRAFVTQYEDSDSHDLYIFDTSDKVAVTVQPAEGSYESVWSPSLRELFTSAADEDEFSIFGLPAAWSVEQPASPVAGEEYYSDLGYTGSLPAMAFVDEEDGALPPGLTFDPDTMTLSGTPTVAGTYTFTINAGNAYGTADPRVFTMTVEPAAVDPVDEPGGTDPEGTDPATSTPAATGTLASTGANATPFLVGGGVLVLGGAAAMIIARRRRGSSTGA